MTNRPSQQDQVRLVICNLQPKYGDHIKLKPIESFTKLYKVGLLTVEEVQASKNKGCNNNKSFKKRNNNPSSSKSNEVNDLATEKRGYQKSQRTFTPLGMSLEEALTRLIHAKGPLQALGLLQTMFLRIDPRSGILMLTASTIKERGI